jgi:hypothetical protein
MGHVSLTNQIKGVEAHVTTILALQDLDFLGLAQRELLTTIRHQVIDTRLEVRDYEYADTRVHQLEHAKAGQAYLDGLRQNIMRASEHNIFGPVDVAQLTAQLDSIKEQLS